MLIFIAPINYKNIFATKISRFTVSIETATAMHTKGTESKRSIFYCQLRLVGVIGGLEEAMHTVNTIRVVE